MENNIGPIINTDAIRNIGLNRENLNVIHFNAQSIVPGHNSYKIHEIRSVFADGYFDVIGISETWLKEFIVNESIEMEGYRLYRMDRSVGRAGGVCMYVKSGLNARIVCEISNYCESERLIVEIKLDDRSKILVGVLYLPYGNIRSCEDVIAHFSSQCENIVLVGDLNINLFESNTDIKNFTRRYGLNIVHNSSPTHFCIQSNSSSLIDYFLVSDCNLVESKGQFIFPSLNSHHAAIYLSYKLRKNVRSYDVQIRDYSCIDINQCMLDIEASNLESIYTTNDCNTQLNTFNITVLDIFNRHVPLKVLRRRRHTDCTKHPCIIAARERRDLAYRAYMENKCQVNWEIFFKHRNQLKRIMRKQRAKYLQRFFKTSSSKDRWAELKKLGYCNSSPEPAFIDPNLCNDYFTLPRIENPPAMLFESTQFEPFNGFSFRNVTADEIWSAMYRIKSNAIGDDEIPLKFLKIMFLPLARHISHIFNTILTTSTFPRAWTCARIIPVPKISNPNQSSDYRLLVFCRLFQKC